ncbi:curli biogenesis system outer membrane secretion channel CsgG [Luteibacter rhizovicinus]|uniref:Curli biogenesis system outer membrane secretion channel CsgG n=1 Tax=Luteibacter rhizovicinus TaxID=242606 RepID=A0A4R3YVS0_9GAMM|nr:CsgG/HfaB family protein [Luteibacter rhizovicinus]TCV97137.1 curli biogenesis system outer membrane secretion channel CsgG [Luteibacter rhizovicinus]
MDSSRKRIFMGAVLLTSVVGLAGCQVNAQVRNAQKEHEKKVAEIPRCTKKLGTISVEEPDAARNWWTGQQLPSPSKLIKVFVSKSGCFTLLDRGAGMNAAMRERALASGGELLGSSNMGKGQVKAADYVLLPDLISSNQDAGGSAVTGLLGGLIGGTAGNLVGGVSMQSKTADVVLTVTDVRSSEQVAMVEGHAEKTDFGFGANGRLWGATGLGGAGVGGYANTKAGQVITMAYLEAYTKLVTELGGLPSSASADNARQAATVAKPARLLSTPSGAGKPVRSLDPGMMLYPTGNKQGAMWEVEDEMGNRGWVSSTLLQLSR